MERNVNGEESVSTASIGSVQQQVATEQGNDELKKENIKIETLSELQQLRYILYNYLKDEKDNNINN